MKLLLESSSVVLSPCSLSLRLPLIDVIRALDSNRLQTDEAPQEISVLPIRSSWVNRLRPVRLSQEPYQVKGFNSRWIARKIMSICSSRYDKWSYSNTVLPASTMNMIARSRTQITSQTLTATVLNTSRSSFSRHRIKLLMLTNLERLMPSWIESVKRWRLVKWSRLWRVVTCRNQPNLFHKFRFVWETKLRWPLNNSWLTERISLKLKSQSRSHR